MSNDPQSETVRLRVGHGPWRAPESAVPWSRPRDSFRTDCLIVGAGITGALLAEHLASRGYRVALVDRLVPGCGSTAASTAMLQWEIDASVADLMRAYDLEHAGAAYRHSFTAVQGLAALIRRRAIGCAFRWRDAIFLAGENDGPETLEEEHRLRRRVRLPGVFLTRERLADRFGLYRPAAIVSPGAAEVDPLCLARELLLCAVADGARLVHDEAIAYDLSSSGVTAALAGGHEVAARHLILATGYDLPDFVPAPAHRLSASWAAVTAPDTPLGFWRDGALVWEDAEPYIYARTTADGRILVGGEDEAVNDPHERARLTPPKAAALHAKLGHLWGVKLPPFETAWSAAFGETADGLPLIGAVPGCPNAFAAYGYGGNGITFSYLASRLIAGLIAGETGSWIDAFALDRPPV